MNTLYSRLFAWLDDMTPANVTVIVRDQNAAAPPRPYVTFRLTETGDLATYRYANADDDGNQDVTRFKTLTASLAVYGRSSQIFEAENIAQQIMDGLYFTE